MSIFDVTHYLIKIRRHESGKRRGPQSKIYCGTGFEKFNDFLRRQMTRAILQNRDRYLLLQIILKGKISCYREQEMNENVHILKDNLKNHAI